eukprot:m.264118 g.264118  ORF g.264118 m.264118 type:complete len:287 (+) comp40465_c0_seq3:183-1043(+)
MGNIGALAYYLAERCQRQKSHKKLQIGTILAIYVIGTVSCLLLAFLWDKTDYIAGAEHSVALLSLTVVLAMVDCITSMTFLPYMNPHLIAALFVGEGLSGMIPSVLGLIQTQNVPSPNVSSMFCPNQTLGDLRFSIGEYFGLLVALMLLSFVGFLGLNLYPGMKKLRGKNQEAPLIHEDEGEGVECCETCMDHSEESEEVAIVQTTEEEIRRQNLLFRTCCICLLSKAGSIVLPMAYYRLCLPMLSFLTGMNGQQLFSTLGRYPIPLQHFSHTSSFLGRRCFTSVS